MCVWGGGSGVGAKEAKWTQYISNEHHSHTERKGEKETKENKNQSHWLTSTVLGDSGAGVGRELQTLQALQMDVSVMLSAAQVGNYFGY